MTRLRRRELLGAAVGIAAGCRRLGPRVVIIGGGFAGAACARALRWLAPSARVTLVERRPRFFTGPFTNAVAAGIWSPERIRTGPQAVAADGVEVLFDDVVELDPVARRVRTASGRSLVADRVVVAPGIELCPDRVQGLESSARNFPAWTGDQDVLALARRVREAPEGAVAVIAPPALPYRCPPGPYERASLLAHALVGRRGKVLVLDAEDDFTKRALFRLEWDVRHPKAVTWVPRSEGGAVVQVRGDEVETESGERVRADILSVLPPQRAGGLAQSAGLADASGWCPVHPATFESRRFAAIHVIGDAADAHPMPKSAFSGHAQAHLVAVALARIFAGRPLVAEKLVNTCFSLTTPKHAVSVSAVYGIEPGADRITLLRAETSPLSAADDLREKEALLAEAAYDALVASSFGRPRK